MAEKPPKKKPAKKATNKAPNIDCNRLWARRVNVTDDDENVRATIAAEGKRAYIALFDEDGLERVTIGVEGKNEAVIGINGKNGILVGMRVAADGRRVLQVNDDDGRCVFEAGVDGSGAPYIQLVNPDGSKIWEMRRQK